MTRFQTHTTLICRRSQLLSPSASVSPDVKLGSGLRWPASKSQRHALPAWLARIGRRSRGTAAPGLAHWRVSPHRGPITAAAAPAGQPGEKNAGPSRGAIGIAIIRPLQQRSERLLHPSSPPSVLASPRHLPSPSLPSCTTSTRVPEHCGDSSRGHADIRHQVLGCSTRRHAIHV